MVLLMRGLGWISHDRAVGCIQRLSIVSWKSAAWSLRRHQGGIYCGLAQIPTERFRMHARSLIVAVTFALLSGAAGAEVNLSLAGQTVTTPISGGEHRKEYAPN